MELLALIMYKLNTLLEEITSILKLPEDKFLFDSKRIVEQMEYYKNDRLWFGGMGLSTKILVNNTEIYFVLILLIVKMLVGKLILNFISEEFKKKFSLNFSPIKIFILECIPLTPFMIISALTNLIEFKLSIFNEKLNIIGQILSLFLCISLIGVHYVLRTSKNRNK